MMFLPDVSHSFTHPSTFVKWFQGIHHVCSLVFCLSSSACLRQRDFFFHGDLIQPEEKFGCAARVGEISF